MNAVYVPVAATPRDVACLLERARIGIAQAIARIHAGALDAVICVFDDDDGPTYVTIAMRAILLATPGGSAEVRARLASPAPAGRFHVLTLPPEGSDRKAFCGMLDAVLVAEGGNA